MRAVLQRVDRATVRINEATEATIEKGLLVFLGVERGDTRADADYLLNKIINLRIFEDQQGKMNESLLDRAGQLLVVSQFTLLADCRKGRRPSFVGAQPPEEARGLFDYFVYTARNHVSRVSAGRFQEHMKIELVNDGPVTIVIDSRQATAGTVYE